MVLGSTYFAPGEIIDVPQYFTPPTAVAPTSPPRLHRHPSTVSRLPIQPRAIDFSPYDTRQQQQQPHTQVQQSGSLSSSTPASTCRQDEITGPSAIDSNGSISFLQEQIAKISELQNSFFKEFSKFKQCNKGDDTKNICPLCCEKYGSAGCVSVVLVPCGHIVCEVCSKKLNKKCHLCKAKFKSTQKIFI